MQNKQREIVVLKSELQTKEREIGFFQSQMLSQQQKTVDLELQQISLQQELQKTQMQLSQQTKFKQQTNLAKQKLVTCDVGAFSAAISQVLKMRLSSEELQVLFSNKFVQPKEAKEQVLQFLQLVGRQNGSLGSSSLLLQGNRKFLTGQQILVYADAMRLLLLKNISKFSWLKAHFDLVQRVADYLTKNLSICVFILN